MRKIQVTVEGLSAAPRVTFVDEGTPIVAVTPPVAPNGLPVLAALANNDVAPLFHPLLVTTTLRPLTLDDEHGWRVYRWSLCFILSKAAHKAGISVRVRHSFGTGLYCSVEWPSGEDQEKIIEELEAQMRRIVEEDIPITYMLQSYEEAIELFSETGQNDKLYLLRHRNPPIVAMVECDGFLDLLQEALVNRTGLLSCFALTPYANGLVLRLPFRNSPHVLAPLTEREHLFKIYHEHICWGRILGVTTASELNQVIMRKDSDELVRVAEALHDKKFADIASQIVSRNPRPRLILIAGPSSSGKTTSAKRITTHLRVLGMRPFLISTDDYFVGDASNPRDENGKLDYEHIQAVNVERLNKDIGDLLAGREVRLPRFDFKQHAAVEREEISRLEEGQVIIMEGIHCLNPDLTPHIKPEEKFRIYISALTQLGIDNSYRVSTTDNRLLRRMVRDNQFRGRAAVDTLRMWPSVMRGERRWIFPFQHLADATFNSALDYEIAVLKSSASALLNTVKSSMPEYVEARRLSGMLQNFMSIPAFAVPGDSILREYIGGSQLTY